MKLDLTWHYIKNNFTSLIRTCVRNVSPTHLHTYIFLTDFSFKNAWNFVIVWNALTCCFNSLLILDAVDITLKQNDTNNYNKLKFGESVGHGICPSQDFMAHQILKIVEKDDGVPSCPNRNDLSNCKGLKDYSFFKLL